MTHRLPIYDCAIVGAGPAGMTAALYLARYRRNVVVFDGGRSRAQWIPESHNVPGFPSGVSGAVFLERMHAQLSAYDVVVCNTRVTELKKTDTAFLLLDSEGNRLEALKVILATGIIDVLPAVEWVDSAIHVGAMRLCAICDVYEVTDESIAVYGPGNTALAHAAFLRTYSTNVTVVCSDGDSLDDAGLDRAARSGVRVIEQTSALLFDGRRCSFVTDGGTSHAFDSVYPFLGCRAQSGLAETSGAAHDENGALIVDRDQMSSVGGLYAAGDVVSSINQISIAIGHSAVAATAVHRALDSNPKML